MLIVAGVVGAIVYLAPFTTPPDIGDLGDHADGRGRDEVRHRSVGWVDVRLELRLLVGLDLRLGLRVDLRLGLDLRLRHGLGRHHHDGWQWRHGLHGESTRLRLHVVGPGGAGTSRPRLDR